MKKWYILRVKGGQEEKTKTNIENFILSNSFYDIFDEVKVLPYIKENQKIKKGKKDKSMQGSRYLCISVDLETKPAIKEQITNIDGVYGFLGLKGPGIKQNPVPVSNREINDMLKKREEKKIDSMLAEYNFSEGQKVKVIPLGDKIGTIKKILPIHKKLIVVTQLFQQDFTELEVSYAEVKKID